MLSGIRAGKSLLAAAIAVHATQTCDLSKLGSGEVPRFSVVSLTRDLAHVTFRHIVGNLLAQPRLRGLLMGEPTADTVVLRHPSGRPVEIRVVAGARAGASLVARWSAGCIFDEAPRMMGASEAVVNISDARTAVIGRLLPGAQIISIGSPWAPYGPIYEVVTDRWKRPGEDVVVVKAPGPRMNPQWWTPERCEALKKTDPTAYQTDVLAEFVSPEESLFPAALLDRCTREIPGDVPFVLGQDYVAAIDPATRGNAWTLVIATKDADQKHIACVRQWQGSKTEPLRPASVLAEIKGVCAAYGLSWAYSDQYAADALVDIASSMSLDLVIEDWTAKNKVQLFSNLATEMAAGRITIPPDTLLRKDLTTVKRRVTQNGVTVVLPKTPDGRHADYAAAAARAFAPWLEEAVEQAPPLGTLEYKSWIADEMERQELDMFESESSRPWWDHV